jgi:hypothetical protein
MSTPTGKQVSVETANPISATLSTPSEKQLRAYAPKQPLTAALNPGHVAITIHNYRWRTGVADGERKYDDMEKRLAALPPVRVPAITMEGDNSGAIISTAQHIAISSRASMNTVSSRGVRHNLPQASAKLPSTLMILRICEDTVDRQQNPQGGYRNLPSDWNMSAKESACQYFAVVRAAHY